MDSIAPVIRRVGQIVDWNAGLDRTVLEGTVALLFREKVHSVGYNEAHVARARLIHAGEIHFVKNPMADREPDFAVLVERGSDAAFRAGGPARWNAGPSRCVAGGGFSHVCSLRRKESRPI